MLSARLRVCLCILPIRNLLAGTELAKPMKPPLS